jgi:hypothetical protein
MTIAERVAKEKEALNKNWANNHNPYEVMALWIKQDIEAIEENGFNRPLSDAEWEAKETLGEQWKVIREAWRKICEVEDNLPIL